jgi:uncharacterized protein YfeS
MLTYAHVCRQAEEMGALSRSAAVWNDAVDILEEREGDKLRERERERERDGSTQVLEGQDFSEPSSPEANLLLALEKEVGDVSKDGLLEEEEEEKEEEQQVLEQQLQHTGSIPPSTRHPARAARVDDDLMLINNDMPLPYVGDEGEDAVKLQALLLQSCLSQVQETEHVFGLYVAKKFEQVTVSHLSDGVKSVHDEIRRRFLELRELKSELSSGPSGSGWLAPHLPLVRRLRKHVNDLQERIWCYCESGDYERADPNIDPAALVKRMKELKVLPEDSDDDATMRMQLDSHQSLPFPTT